MNETLRDLYYGRIQPFATKLARDDELDMLIGRSKELEREVAGSLDEAGKAKFTEFLNVDTEFGDNQQFYAFARGFRIGVRLMLDTLTDDPVKE